MPYCKNCGADMSPGAKFCYKCGMPAAAEPAPAAEPVSPEPAAPVVTELCCPECGAPYEPGMKFCDECGAALPPAGKTEKTPEPAREEMQAAPASPVRPAAPEPKQKEKKAPKAPKVKKQEKKQEAAVPDTPEANAKKRWMLTDGILLAACVLLIILSAVQMPGRIRDAKAAPPPVPDAEWSEEELTAGLETPQGDPVPDGWEPRPQHYDYEWLSGKEAGKQ